VKHLSEETLVGFAFLFIVFCVLLSRFGTNTYTKYLDTYNTQKDREMFLKSYEIVIECRKSYGPNTNIADKVCGEVPTFYNEEEKRCEEFL
jgi:hypothetical protein